MYKYDTHCGFWRARAYVGNIYIYLLLPELFRILFIANLFTCRHFINHDVIGKKCRYIIDCQGLVYFIIESKHLKIVDS